MDCAAYTNGSVSYRSVSTLSGTGGVVATLRAVEDTDSWYTWPSAGGTTTGTGIVEFTTCGVVSMDFICLFDRDPTTGENKVEFWVNGGLVGTVFPGKTDGATADPEKDGVNVNNSGTISLVLTGCVDTIKIIGIANNTGTGGNTMNRTDVTAVVKGPCIYSSSGSSGSSGGSGSAKTSGSV